jgi:hypothetical protein
MGRPGSQSSSKSLGAQQSPNTGTPAADTQQGTLAVSGAHILTCAPSSSDVVDEEEWGDWVSAEEEEWGAWVSAPAPGALGSAPAPQCTPEQPALKQPLATQASLVNTAHDSALTESAAQASQRRTLREAMKGMVSKLKTVLRAGAHT